MRPCDDTHVILWGRLLELTVSLWCPSLRLGALLTPPPLKLDSDAAATIKLFWVLVWCSWAPSVCILLIHRPNVGTKVSLWERSVCVYRVGLCVCAGWVCVCVCVCVLVCVVCVTPTPGRRSVNCTDNRSSNPSPGAG